MFCDNFIDEILKKPVTSFAKCKYHPQVQVEYYCHLCQVPVCVHCKMVGSHATGDAVSHKLTPIKEAYELAMMASRRVRLLEIHQISHNITSKSSDTSAGSLSQ